MRMVAWIVSTLLLLLAPTASAAGVFLDQHVGLAPPVVGETVIERDLVQSAFEGQVRQFLERGTEQSPGSLRVSRIPGEFAPEELSVGAMLDERFADLNYVLATSLKSTPLGYMIDVFLARLEQRRVVNLYTYIEPIGSTLDFGAIEKRAMAVAERTRFAMLDVGSSGWVAAAERPAASVNIGCITPSSTIDADSLWAGRRLMLALPAAISSEAAKDNAVDLKFSMVNGLDLSSCTPLGEPSRAHNFPTDMFVFGEISHSEPGGEDGAYQVRVYMQTTRDPVPSRVGEYILQSPWDASEISAGIVEKAISVANEKGS